MTTRTLTLAALFSLGCSADLGTARGPLKDAAPLASWDDAGAPPAIPGDDEPPLVSIEAAELGERTIHLSGTALDDRGVVAMTVRAGLSGPNPVPGTGFAKWSIDVALPDGPLEIEITAFDEGGRSGSATYNVDAPTPVDVMPPTIVITAPDDGYETNQPSVTVTGITGDDHGVVKVALTGNDGPLGTARTGDHFGAWALEVPLAPGATEQITATATDAAGNASSASLTVRSRAAPTHGPPQITATTPGDGARVDSARVPFEITVDGFAAVVAAAVRIDDGPWQSMGGSSDRWATDLVLRPGENALRVIARDADGLVGRARLSLVVDDGWTDGPRLTLRAPTPPGGLVEMALDREAVNELFPVDIQRDTVLIALDPRPMIANALNTVRASCVEGEDGPLCPPDWGAPERNLWRLLTMTAQTTDANGTRLQPAVAFTERFFEAGILPVDFGGLLAMALQVAPDDFVLPNDAVVDAVVSQLLGTHPGTLDDGSIEVTLEDGLRNMETLNAKLGPTADHPGVLSGASANVLAPDFMMRLVLDSNLRFFEGIDLARASKRYLADKLPDSVVVDLEFIDPERFTLQGLVDNPGVTFDFGMVEHDAFVAPGETISPRPRGRSEAWRIEPWTLERIVAQATYNAFGDLRTPCELCGGVDTGALLFVDAEIGTDLVEVAIGSNGYDCFAGGAECTNGVPPTPPGLPEHFEYLEDPPAGWFRLWVPAGLVQTPPSMYLWDLVLEVAQVRIRDENVPEGEGDARFHLEEIPVGLSAAALEAGVRSALQAQREDVAERLLGGFADQNEPLDLYVDAADGRLWLVASSCLDPLPAAACRRPNAAGFYGDAEGTIELHAVLPDGRRAMALAGPAIAYFREGDSVHRLEIESVTADQVTVWVRGREE